MLYLEDYLELIEHLPQELRDRLTLIRENDLKVNNSNQHIDTKVKQFFAEAKKLSPEQRQCNFESILEDYGRTVKDADEKLQLADQTSEIMVKLIQKLDGELEKFKLELEADHAGITEQLERRSLELDSAARLDNHINGSLNLSSSSRHYNNRLVNGRCQPSNSSSRQNSTATSPAPYGYVPAGGPPSIIGDHHMPNGVEANGGGHYNTNLTSFGHSTGFKTSYKNNHLPYNQHHSALSAALSSAVTPTTVHNNKISQNGTTLKGSEFADGTNNTSLVRQNPLAAAASQAIVATQQVRTRLQTRKLYLESFSLPN